MKAILISPLVHHLLYICLLVFTTTIITVSIFRSNSPKLVYGFVTPLIRVRVPSSSSSSSSSSSPFIHHSCSSQFHPRGGRQEKTIYKKYSFIETLKASNRNYSSGIDSDNTKLQSETLNNLTVIQIKDILRSEGLKVTGKKADLIQRWITYQSTKNTQNTPQDIEKQQEEEENKSTFSIMSPPKTTGKRSSKNNSNTNGNSDDTTKTIRAKKAKVEPQRITEKDELIKLWNAEEALQKGSYTFKIMSWNVAGLRALMRKEPNTLSKLASEHKLDVICLQETKLQESHVEDPTLKIKEILLDDGYESHFSCSTAKKGYAGTCVFVKLREDKDCGPNREDESKKNDNKVQGKLDGFFFTKTNAAKPNDKSLSEKKSTAQSELGDIDIKNLIPLGVSMKMGKDDHDSEGRIITIDYPQFSITNLYVPNSGQKLERLTYRTDSWDKDLLNYLTQKESNDNKPVIWLGDLNVAHTWKDCWNDGAKHLAKQAGTTAEERQSFQEMLDNDNNSCSFVDAFRFLYPDAKGHYTYWSQRANNREPNKGLRLDYFICSSSLMKDEKDKKVVVRDSYMIHDQNGSDHCPIVLEIEIRK